MKRYKHIIFDLDGTLMDTSGGIMRSVKEVIGELSLTQLPDDQIQKFIGPPVEVSFKSYCHTNEEDTVKSASLFRKTYAEKYLLYAKVYDGIVDLLGYCRQNQLECSVATYKRASYTQTLINKMGIRDYFKFVEGSDDEGKLHKKDIIQLCINKSGIDSEQTIMIGDTVNDEQAAKQVGIDYIAVTYGFGYKTPKDVETAVFTADTPKQIMEFIIKNHTTTV